MKQQEDALSAIGRQKKMGQTIVGCFPLYPPVELFSAMGLLPVVLWHLKANTPSLTASDHHVQNYACGIARELVQFVLTHTNGYLDGIFSYNACDTLRNLPEILAAGNAAAGRAIPMLRMHIPQVNRTQTDPDSYFKHKIAQLIHDIEHAFGVTYSTESFQRTIVSYTRMRKLCLEAEHQVAEGALSFASFCSVVLTGYFLPIEEQIANLLKLMATAESAPLTSNTGVVVSGIMPPSPNVLRAMETAGLRVAANDIASLRRSYGYSPEITDHPGAYYTDLFANRFPCTTLLYQTDARVKTFLNLVESSDARGVIFCGEKFCEHEYFEFPYLEQRLKDQGIPVLRLEFGVDDTMHTKAYTTRIEAFAELLN